MIPSGSYVALALVAATVLAWLLARILLLTRQGRTEQATRLARTGTVVWAIGLLIATLRGSPPMGLDERPVFVFVPFSSHNTVLDYEIALNCLLFTPSLCCCRGRRGGLPRARSPHRPPWPSALRSSSS
ncbi:hypothetical protein OG394_38250 [Kribbella sp. NBC_01245]|uniref:hypothetical protein n=1 Tax=Kribbella sp. NBC_01245 TaxID=2903578 RepID=UPI002E2C882F|nr:hypothetical protein [Kribbella sp. NBC_01245]